MGLSVFVGITSIFVAMMAFGVARHVEDPALSRWLGVAALVVCVTALYKGRKSLAWTSVTTVAFLVINAVLIPLAMSGA